jgi:hypothetical protein
MKIKFFETTTPAFILPFAARSSILATAGILARYKGGRKRARTLQRLIQIAHGAVVAGLSPFFIEHAGRRVHVLKPMRLPRPAASQ